MMRKKKYLILTALLAMLLILALFVILYMRGREEVESMVVTENIEDIVYVERTSAERTELTFVLPIDWGSEKYVWTNQ